jgi:predicted 3-demethylubiquinone-9 3-methyltransferase (glyoxalase superfamily)
MPSGDDMPKITPFLWFDHQAEEAAKFYTSVFKNSKLGQVTRYGAGAPAPAGSVMTASFRIEDQEFTALNGGPLFKFNESVSFVVHCNTQQEVDYFWEKLTSGGTPSQCGWLKDKFGLSWQVVPDILIILGTDKQHPEKAGRVMQAMMKMTKIDIQKLKDAYDGK